MQRFKTETGMQKYLKVLIFVFLFLFFACLHAGRSFGSSLYAEEKEPETAWGKHGFSPNDQEVAAVRQETQDAVAAMFGLGKELFDQPAVKEKEEAEKPIVVNADKIEYSANTKNVIATGDVKVDYKDSILTAQRMVINTETKDAEAEGNARLEDSQGVKEGTKITYNFETKKGNIIDAEFRSNPYFGRAVRIDKPSADEFIIKKGYMSTCSMDRPHYRMGFKKVNYFPEDKVRMRGTTFYFWNIPLVYFPEYNHSLKDPLMHVQIVPGKDKNWGGYMLTIWRCNLNEHLNGRLYLDYRDNLGFAEGYGFNYDSRVFGKGDVKYYYTEEDPKKFQPKDNPNTEFQRAMTRWRHKWRIGPFTTFMTEFYKILDSKRKKGGLNNSYNFLKDYFLREYEKDEQPLTYAQFHHSFRYLSFDFYLQRRINHWYATTDELPTINLNLPSLQIGNLPVYFDNTSTITDTNTKITASTANPDGEQKVTQVNTSNSLSFPVKVAFIRFSPNIRVDENYYNQDIYGAASISRTVFYSGADLSTKFYRLFDIKSNFLGMDINRLRHIITPTIAYTYTHTPTVPASKLKGASNIVTSQSAKFELSNKLQTKREGQSVDLVDFRVNTTYTFKPKGEDKRGSSFSDILFTLEMLPYSWLRVVSDATLNHSGDRNSESYRKIINANINFEFDFAKDRSFGIGQRYQRKGGNELTYALNWRLSPKWKFHLYHRRQFSKTSTINSGLREQEYSISRDLHCWEMDLTYNVTQGVSKQVWLILRLKAFPEMEFDYNQMYHQPKPGTQSEPNV